MKETKKKDVKKDNNLKTILTKMVPYINLPYAEHILKSIGEEPNSKATMDKSEVLIQAAR